MESLGGGGLSEIPFSKIESIKLFEETRSWSLCVWAFGFCPWLSEWESERHGVVKRRVNGVGEEKGEVRWERFCDFFFSFFLEKRWWKMTLPYIYIYIYIYLYIRNSLWTRLGFLPQQLTSAPYGAGKLWLTMLPLHPNRAPD